MNSGDFFDSLEPEPVAYWLGFFCADGHLYKSGKQASILLAQRDILHLEKLAAVFGRPIQSYQTKDDRTGRTYYSCRLVLNSKYLCSRVMSYGIPQQKTKTLDGKPFDHMPNPSKAHFVRGYFDGDGCITRRGKTEYVLVFAGNVPFLERLRTEIRSGAGVDRGYIACQKGCSHLTWSGIDRLNLIRTWLYANSTVCLERKRDKFNEMPDYLGTSRFLYVHWCKTIKAWIARDYKDGRQITLGRFKTEAEAADARRSRGLPV